MSKTKITVQEARGARAFIDAWASEEGHDDYYSTVARAALMDVCPHPDRWVGKGKPPAWMQASAEARPCTICGSTKVPA